MIERRRMMMEAGEPTPIELEWILAGTSQRYNDYHHYHTAAVGFDHPIYGFALLNTNLSQTWCHGINFSWLPSSLSETTVSYTGNYYGGNTQVRSSSKTLSYGAGLSTNDWEAYYDTEGNITSNTKYRPFSLTDTIEIGGVDRAANIRWTREKPWYLRIIQCGIYDLQNLAILVNKNTPRTPTQFTFA